MTDTVLVAFISCVSSLIGVFATLVVNTCVEFKKSKAEMQLKMYQEKRERLIKVYEKLICIIYTYPNESPNDVLKHIEFAPNYSMESFDIIIRSIDNQIEDYKKQLDDTRIKCEEKDIIETKIDNREYSKVQIIKIRDKYYEAQEKYDLFKQSDKMILDLCAGQNVRNSLVEFETAIHNVFISGHGAKIEDGQASVIEKCRENVIESIKGDIGMY